MKYLIKILIILVVAHLAAATVSAQQAVTPEMRALIVKLTKMIGVNEIFTLLADNITVKLKPVILKQTPNIPERAFDIMREELRATFSEVCPMLVKSSG